VTMLSGMQSDTTKILSDWAEIASIKRPAITYGSGGIQTEIWNIVVTSTSVDVQPIRGDYLIEAEKLNIKSTHIIETEYNLNVKINDRIYVGSNFYRVDYIKDHEDHLTVFGMRFGNKV